MVDIGLQRGESVEVDRAVARRVGAGGEDVDAVAFGDFSRHLVLGVLVEDVHAVAGGARQDDLFDGVAFAVDEDGVLDRFVDGLDEAAEFAHVEVDPAVLVELGLLGDENHFADQDAGVADEGASRLDENFGGVVSEIVLQEAGDLLTVELDVLGGGDVVGGEAAAEIEHAQMNALFGQRIEEVAAGGDGVVPLADVTLLRADVERDAVGVEAQFGRLEDKPVDGVGVGPEFARQWPVGAASVGEDAEEDAGSWGVLGDLADVLLGVGGEEPDAAVVGVGDVTRLLDRVAVTHVVGLGAETEHLIQLEYGKAGVGRDEP